MLGTIQLNLLLRRNLHYTRRLLQVNQPSQPAANSGATNLPTVDATPKASEDPSPKNAGASGVSESPDDPSDRPSKSTDNSNYGSAWRRRGRNLKRDIPSLQLPQQFLERNVILQDDPAAAALKVQTGIIKSVDTSVKRTAPHLNEEVEMAAATQSIGDQAVSTEDASTEVGQPVWHVDFRIMKEIDSTVQASLQAPGYHGIGPSTSTKPHLVLHCPKKGGIAFLDDLVRHLAKANGADLIKIDAQDLAEIGGDFLDDPGNLKNEPLSSLGYDVHASDEVQDHSATLGNDNSTVTERSTRMNLFSLGLDSVKLLPISTKTVQNLADMLKDPHDPPNPQPRQATPFLNLRGVNAVESIADLKMTVFLDTLLHASSTKRAMNRAESERANKEDAINASQDTQDRNGSSTVTQSPSKESPQPPPVLLLQINDYPEIFHTESGYHVMAALHSALYQRRLEGQKIMLIGTCAADSSDLATSRLGYDSLLQGFDAGPTRTILTPPVGAVESLLEHHRLRTFAINTRHLANMIRRLAANLDQAPTLPSDSNWIKLVGQEITRRLQRQVWSSDYVHRISTVALAVRQEIGADMAFDPVERAFQIIEGSDKAKLTWFFRERERVRNPGGTSKNRKANKSGPGSKMDRAQLEKRCNPNEKGLLNGIIDPSDIRTTFSNVHAPKETLETLKDLTLLPLACPEEFEYGVLAEQNINGLLLYGPPGTGKTLLAKAVAKECGTTILDVSGADLYDKWVGEGEKNVKAMFSLARKLKPCIVFIDEADAILGSRDRDGSRTTHRDLINQFLREWDGMKDVAALIMVATNRPFDLDDAVVRRLPRRILVDLPTEQDREAILKIHLAKENLDPEVSLAKLAADTPLYSGSDLKHLVVTAAQACVRENHDVATTITTTTATTTTTTATTTATTPPSSENSAAEAAGTTDSDPSKTSTTKRVLRPRHFARALEEISASVSEDMGSLTAIKKFDEKYGDRRGKRKKGKLDGGFGFRTLEEGERERFRGEGARVR
ncbi:MAG: hypothetical protein LQ345_004427 [Seirophora villosa]|nr:MAG: hypothetical protein LQ345_004427 [Seirophora villosa]